MDKNQIIQLKSDQRIQIDTFQKKKKKNQTGGPTGTQKDGQHH